MSFEWKGVKGVILDSKYGTPTGTTKIERVDEETAQRLTELHGNKKGGESLDTTWKSVKQSHSDALQLTSKSSKSMNHEDAPVATPRPFLMLFLFELRPHKGLQPP